MIRIKPLFLRLATGGIVVSLAACSGSLLESKKIDYKSAGQAPTLEVPPDLVAPARNERFAVPDAGGRGSATFSAYSGERTQQAQAQRGSDVLPAVEKARIERSGNQRWLVVAGTPDKAWETIREFWQEMGFIIKQETPEAGVMETDWAENRAKLPQDFIRNTIGRLLDAFYSTGERDKFRTRIERGSESGTVEVYVSHRGMVEKYVSEGKDQTKWEPRDPDPDLEAEMLRRLMVRFGTDEQRATALVAASKDRPAERARIVRGSDGSAGTLQLDERFDRAWRRVGLALDRVGFTVEDRDRTQGFYFVRYVDPETDAGKKDDGMFSKLAFWRGKDNAKAQTQYRVFVQDGGEKSTVQILSREGGQDNSETARKILGLLHEQLR
jgi:outer membrane protein assembly factor BamC